MPRAPAVSIADAIKYKNHTDDCIKEVDAAIVRFMTMQRQLIAQKEYIEVAIKNASDTANNNDGNINNTDYRVNLYKHRKMIGINSGYNSISAGLSYSDSDKSHSLFLDDNGIVYSLGNNTNGQLGLDHELERKTPTGILGLKKVIAISAGANHSLILTFDGEVFSFGQNINGQLGHGGTSTDNVTTPTKINTDNIGIDNKIKAISAGTNHSLVLDENGKVYSFGEDEYGRLGLGLGSDSIQKTPTKISGLPNIEQISAGWGHSLVLTENGKVYSFGNNYSGRLGLDDSYDHLEFLDTPKSIDTTNIEAPIKAISAGVGHSLVLDENGKVYSFGDNYYGQLGIKDVNHIQKPTKINTDNIGLDNKIIAISAGYWFSLVLTENGKVYSFGNNANGQLGRVTSRNSLDWGVPTELTAIKNAIDISAGVTNSLVLDVNGTVYSFGHIPTLNQHGTLDTYGSDKPVKIHYVPTMLEVMSNYDKTVAENRVVKSGGGYNIPIFNNSQILPDFVSSDTPGENDKYPERVVLTGINNDLEVFNGVDIMGTKQFLIGVNAILTHPNNITETLPPNIIVVSPDITSDVKWTKDSAGGYNAGHIGDWGVNVCSDVSAGLKHSLVLGRDGKVYSFGYNDFSQLGLGSGSAIEVKEPTRIDISNIDTPIKAISTGGSHCLVLAENGEVYSFGYNYFGQLGLGGTDTTDKSVPTKIDTTNIKEPIIAISAGDYHSLVLTENGKVYSFGWNKYYQLGLGVNDNTPKNVPTLIDTTNIMAPIIAISAGGEHSLVLTENGKVYSFGQNNQSQLGLGSSYNAIHTVNVPTLIDTTNIMAPIIAISAGGEHSLVLTENGKVYSFGLDFFGVLGLVSGSATKVNVPTQIDTSAIKNDNDGNEAPIKAISAGGYHSLVLTENGKVYSFGYNSTGQLGRASSGSISNNVATQIDTSNIISDNGGNEVPITAISAGDYHSIVLAENGRVYSFGEDEHSRLGLGSVTENQTTPQLITTLSFQPQWSWSSLFGSLGDSIGTNRYNQIWSTKPWLNSDGSWAPKTDISSRSVTTDAYLELDLSKDSTVIGLVLQGRKNDSQYVKEIKVKTKTNLSSAYSYVGGNDTVFNIDYAPWNSAVNTSIQVPVMFTNPVIARYVRIYPTDYNNYPAMRVGVMVQDKPYHPGMKQGLTTSILKGLLMQGNKNISTDASTKAIKDVIPDSGMDLDDAEIKNTLTSISGSSTKSIKTDGWRFDKPTFVKLKVESESNITKIDGDSNPSGNSYIAFSLDYLQYSLFHTHETNFTSVTALSIEAGSAIPENKVSVSYSQYSLEKIRGFGLQ